MRTGLDLILSVIALSDVGQDDGTDESFTMNQSDQNISDVPTHYNSKGDSIKKQLNFLKAVEKPAPPSNPIKNCMKSDCGFLF